MFGEKSVLTLSVKRTAFVLVYIILALKSCWVVLVETFYCDLEAAFSRDTYQQVIYKSRFKILCSPIVAKKVCSLVLPIFIQQLICKYFTFLCNLERIFLC